jgi:hypothetical protein
MKSAILTFQIRLQRLLGLQLDRVGGNHSRKIFLKTPLENDEAMQVERSEPRALAPYVVE